MELENQTWETIEPNVRKIEVGESIQGVLKAKKSDVGPNNSMAYYIEDAERKQWLVWGSTVLDNRLELVNVGETIRITRKDDQLNTKKQPTKIFKVERLAVTKVGA